MPNVRLQVEGLKEAAARIDDVGTRAQRPEIVLRSPAVLADLHESEERRFATNTGWKRLTPKWVAEKQRHGWDSRVLRKTGALERELTSGGPDIVFTAWNKTLTFGIRGGRSDLYYAAPLARGVGRAKTKRRMVRVDTIARSRITGRIGHYIAYGVVTR